MYRLGVNNRPVDGHSSETLSDFIDMNTWFMGKNFIKTYHPDNITIIELPADI
jgi:hypothetical protein